MNTKLPAEVGSNERLGLAPERDIVSRLRDVVPEHGWAVVNTKTDGIVIWFSERKEFHTERKARTWLQEHAETHRTHEVRPYENRCIEHEAADEIERWRALVMDYAIACGELSKGLPAEDPMWGELRALGERIPGPNAKLNGGP